MSDASDLKLLAEHAAEIDASGLPAPVLESARACLLYGLAVGIGTVRARPALIAAAAVERDGTADGRGATRLLDGKRAARADAVFANAVLLSGRVQGDSHPCGHLGGVVIPAALAAAEHAGASGAELLSAMVAGYETALRIGRDHAADLSARGFRTTPCYGVFGAGVVAARIMRFDGARIAHTLALAANFAGGLREYVDAGTEESPYQAGFAARNGLYVADLVKSGVSAAPSALHGGAGFYRAFADPGTDYGKRLTEALGSHYEFTTVTYKEFPACQFLRGLIRGMSILRGRAGKARPASIEIRMHPFEADFIGVRYGGPFTSPAQTVMSAPFCAALGWTERTASFAGLRNFGERAVLDLIPKIRIISDEARRRYEPYLRVALDDGAVLEWEDASGAAAYQLTWKAAVSMTHRLCEEVDVPQGLADALIARAAEAEKLPDVRPLIDTVCAATAAARAETATA